MLKTLLTTFGFVKIVLNLTCDPPNPNAVYSMSHIFKYTGVNDLDLFGARYFEASQNTYHYGRSDNTTIYTFLQKLDERKEVVWSKLLQMEPGKYAFDVAPDESIVYFLKCNTPKPIIYGLQTENGDFQYTLESTSSFTLFVDESILVVSQDSSTVYFTTKRGGIHWKIGIWIVSSSTSFKCNDYAIFDFALDIVAIN